MIQTEKLERSMARSLSIGQVTFASFMYYEEVSLLEIFIVIYVYCGYTAGRY